MTKVHYTITLEDGTVFDTSDSWGAPLDISELKEPFPDRVMKRIASLQPGERDSLTLSPEEGFGFRDEELVFEVERNKLPQSMELQIGTVLSLTLDGEELLVTVMSIKDQSVTLDANHPLADRTVVFELKLAE